MAGLGHMGDGWHDGVTLKGRFVLLEPLTPEHAPLWLNHHNPQLFAYMARGAPKEASLEGYREYIQRLNEEPGRLNWAIRVGSDFAGRISYFNVSQRNRSLEVGTFIVKEYQGTKVNPEAKYLMLGRAFEELGVIRIQFKVDARNERSQRAIEKMGAVREGVLRKHEILAGGEVRDSVIYSILDDEWPQVKHWLEARLYR